MTTSIDDFRTARRQDQESAREQDREDRRLAAELARAAKEQARLDEIERRRQEREDEAARREQDRLDAERKANEKREREDTARAAKAQADKEKRREQARRRKERREQFAARLNAAPKWLAEHLDLSAALAVMGCSIVPALMSQAASLKTTGIVTEMGWLGYLLVGLLPVMLECSAWAATAGEAKAMKEQRSPWPYRTAVYAFAGLAAWINYRHGSHVGGEEYGVILGSVLAASSVIPIMVWQLVQLGRHREYRKQMKAARQARKDAAKTREQRKSELPQVWATARRLRAIAGHEKLSEEDAWQAAYGVHEGAGDDEMPEDLLRLLSADMLGLRVDAEARLAVVLSDLAEARAWRREASAKLSGKASEVKPEASVTSFVEGVATLPTRAAQTSVSGLVDSSGKPLLRTVSSQINLSVPPSARTSENAPARTRDTAPARTRKGSGKATVRSMSTGAKRAAAVTAKRASADENEAIEQWIADELKAGRDVTPANVKAETMRRRQERNKRDKSEPSRTWIYDRIGKAKLRRRSA
ncbi:hypothetical protein AB0F96_26810 [Streptomyces sp. NPDC023998]|uniref:hypothetical protein n=1 Tax=Streptomyces sp. NPDC023998 TaxID=3154597 RepID=UPI0033C727F9